MIPKRPLESEIDAALRHTPPILTMKEAAAALDLHYDTVRDHVRQGRLAAARAGRAVRIPRESIARFLRSL